MLGLVFRELGIVFVASGELRLLASYVSYICVCVRVLVHDKSFRGNCKGFDDHDRPFMVGD